MIYEEHDLLIDIPKDFSVLKHDDETEGLQCWKSVDFVVELQDRIFFIEFTDPENPSIPNEHKNINDFFTDKLFNELSEKIRLSFLYEYAMEGVKTPVYYFVIFGLSSLDDALVITQNDKLKKRIPLMGPPGKNWKRRFLMNCGIFNIERWNREFKNLPIKRKSEPR